MGGIGGSNGWWCTEGGGYAVAYLTSHVADHGPGTEVEDALREALGLPAPGAD